MCESHLKQRYPLEHTKYETLQSQASAGGAKRNRVITCWLLQLILVLFFLFLQRQQQMEVIT